MAIHVADSLFGVRRRCETRGNCRRRLDDAGSHGILSCGSYNAMKHGHRSDGLLIMPQVAGPLIRALWCGVSLVSRQWRASRRRGLRHGCRGDVAIGVGASLWLMHASGDWHRVSGTHDIERVYLVDWRGGLAAGEILSQQFNTQFNGVVGRCSYLGQRSG